MICSAVVSLLFVQNPSFCETKNDTKEKITFYQLAEQNWMPIMDIEQLVTDNTLICKDYDKDGCAEDDKCFGVIILRKNKEAIIGDFKKNDRVIGKWRWANMMFHSYIEISPDNRQQEFPLNIEKDAMINEQSTHLWVNYPRGRMICQLNQGVDEKIVITIKDAKWKDFVRGEPLGDVIAKAWLKGTLLAAAHGIASGTTEVPFANSGSSSSTHVSESKKVDSKKVPGNFECSFMCYDYSESVLDWSKHTSSEKTITIAAEDKSAAEKIGRDAATKECKNMGHFDAYSRWGKGTISCIKQ